MSELQPLFDYEALPEDVRSMVQEHTGEIRTLARRAAQDIVEIGERLKAVRDVLESEAYGQFDGWLKSEFDWSRRAAYRFIQVADAFSCANLAQLNIAPSALYALASGSTPDFIRREVVEMAQATGEPVTHKAVKERLEAHWADTPPLDESYSDTTAPPDVEGTPAPESATAPRHTAPMKKKSSFTPPAVELEEVEMADGERMLTPKLPSAMHKLEIERRNWDKAANRFENAASGALTYLGRLSAYTPEELREVIRQPEAQAKGARARLLQLEERLAEIQDLVAAVRGEGHVVEADLFEEEEPPRVFESLN